VCTALQRNANCSSKRRASCSKEQHSAKHRQAADVGWAAPQLRLVDEPHEVMAEAETQKVNALCQVDPRWPFVNPIFCGTD
jgi:ABC-type uncharacterized transport system ATPase subunit